MLTKFATIKHLNWVRKPTLLAEHEHPENTCAAPKKTCVADHDMMAKVNNDTTHQRDMRCMWNILTLFLLLLLKYIYLPFCRSQHTNGTGAMWSNGVLRIKCRRKTTFFLSQQTQDTSPEDSVWARGYSPVALSEFLTSWTVGSLNARSTSYCLVLKTNTPL